MTDPDATSSIEPRQNGTEVRENGPSLNAVERYLLRKGGAFEANSSRLLREIAYERLKDAIRYADLQPGEHLSEVRLSRILGISRTPLREAVQQLAQEGLLNIIPGRAIVVPYLSVQETHDLVHMRLLIEPEVARSAAECTTPQAARTLHSQCTKMRRAAESDDRVAWSKADEKFHETLTHLCPNEMLGKTARQLFNRMHHLATANRTSQERLIECTREHQAVADAIASRDGNAAAAAMKDHLKQLQHSLVQELAGKRW